MVSFVSKIFVYHTWGDVILESGWRQASHKIDKLTMNLLSLAAVVPELPVYF
jgi:hypothetical protein